MQADFCCLVLASALLAWPLWLRLFTPRVLGAGGHDDGHRLKSAIDNMTTGASEPSDPPL